MKLLDEKILENNIIKVAEYDLNNENLFGCSYFVYQEGNTVLKKHFGTKDAEGINPVDDFTMFRLASMTKPVTSVAILILADRGMIKLSDNVSRYFPEFKNIHIITPEGEDLGRPKNEVSVLHLLTHTSGFGSVKPVKMADEDRKSISSMIKYFYEMGLDFEPFSREGYSPIAAFDVLAAIIQKVSGMKYAEFLNKEIFLPCNMKHTTFCPTDNEWKNFIVMHDKVDGKNAVGNTFENCVFENIPVSHPLGGAGLASTLSDYSNFAKMLLNGGMTDNGRIISEETLKEILRPHVPKTIMPKDERWGLGVRVITEENYPHLPVGTYGWSGAYGSHFWVDPVNKICAVFMKNSKFDGGSGNCSACRFEEAVHNALTK